MKIYRCHRLHIKIICRSFRILTPCLLFEIYTPEILNMFVYEHAETVEFVKK